MPRIEEGINSFKVYEEGTDYYGIAEVQLPEISQITEEISGAGIAGNLTAVFTGHVEAMKMTFNFRTLQKSQIRLAEQRNHMIDLRAAQQGRDTTTGKIYQNSAKHALSIRPIKLAPGKLAPASGADASGEYAVDYWKIEFDNKKVLEIDPANFIYMVNGIDYMADVRKALGM